MTCPDTYYLYDEQSQYLSSLLGQLNDTILATIQALKNPGVAVADISQAMTGPDGTSHRWCTEQPWAYGLSIYTVYQPLSAWSQAPFHPTRDGHKRIAELVLPVVDSLFATGPTTTKP